MKKKMAMLALIVLIVAISGCTVSTTPKATYSANGISFEYPSDLKEDTFPGELNSGSGWEILDYFTDGDINIGVYKNPTQGDPELVRDATILSINTYDLGTNQGSSQATNAQGVQMFKNTATLNDTTNNRNLQYYNAFFLVNGEVFQVSVYGEKGNSKIENIADQVFDSLKIT